MIPDCSCLTISVRCVQVRVLFEENNVMNEENKRLFKLCNSKTEYDCPGEHSPDTTNKV